MFFSWCKKRKLAAEAKKQEEQRIKEEEIRKEKEYAAAYNANLETFYKICDMVRSLPKERQIVVIQRRNIFKENSVRSWFYKQLAHEMFLKHRAYGLNWMSDYDDSLYAFYAPTKMNPEFREALKEFSKNGYIIQRIRYYHFDY